MATQRECPQHAQNQLILFCGKCIRPLCLACLIQHPGCPVAENHPHDLSQLENMPAFLRNQLDSIQVQLKCEQNALLDRAKSFSNEAQSREAEFNTHVERVLQSRDEALQILQQLQTAIRAAATSAIASVLRAGVESDGGKQNVEDVHVRSLACRQQRNTIARLRNMNDASLVKEVAFVRNLIRCAEPTAPNTTPPAPSPAGPPSALQSSESSSCLPPAKELAIESQMQNIVKQGKQLIQSLEKFVAVCNVLLCPLIFLQTKL